LENRPEILLLSDSGELDGLGGRLLLNAFRGRPTRSLDEARELVAEQVDPPIHAVVLPASLDFAGRAQELESLRKAARSVRLRYVAIGEEADAEARQAMDRVGVDYLLLEPVSDSQLRFVLNAAVWQPGKTDARRRQRIPTDLVARIHAASGMKVASVYNLSATGAFLETPRPNQEQARVEVEIPLPSGTLRLPARVTLTNVAGNLKRDNLPRGMGVQFTEVGPADKAELERYVEEQAARYRP
jgi:hypothetical protein